MSDEKQNSPPIFHIPQLDKLDKIEAMLHEIREQRANVLGEYISKENFMKQFGIKAGLFYKLINSHVLKVYRLKSKIYLRQSEVDEAIKKGLLK